MRTTQVLFSRHCCCYCCCCDKLKTGFALCLTDVHKKLLKQHKIFSIQVLFGPSPPNPHPPSRFRFKTDTFIVATNKQMVDLTYLFFVFFLFGFFAFLNDRSDAWWEMWWAACQGKRDNSQELHTFPICSHRSAFLLNVFFSPSIFAAVIIDCCESSCSSVSSSTELPSLRTSRQADRQTPDGAVGLTRSNPGLNLIAVSLRVVGWDQARTGPVSSTSFTSSAPSGSSSLFASLLI